MGLAAMNQSRKAVELNYELECNKRLATVYVDGVNGGSLKQAGDWETVVTSGELVVGTTYVILEFLTGDDFSNIGGANVSGTVFIATGTTPTTWTHASVVAESLTIKDIIDCGYMDKEENFIPVEWMGSRTSNTLWRQQNRFRWARGWRRDEESEHCHYHRRQDMRFAFSGDRVWRVPKAPGPGNDPPNPIYKLVLEVTVFANDWVSSQLKAGDDDANWTDIWTIHANQYLIWQTVINLNNYFKQFVPRQEGNLPPPSEMAATGLAAFLSWDQLQFAQHQIDTR